MKPLLILAPSPTRWPAFEQLLREEDPRVLEDLRIRLSEGVEGAGDALAVLPESTHNLACACLRRRHDVGTLGSLFTAPTHRQKGYARALLQSLLSWFDMSGGKWLYLTGTRALAEDVFEKFGFQVLHAAGPDRAARVTMLRTPAHVGENPFERLSESLAIKPASRADWPLMMALMQHYVGADPRVPLDESALTAEAALIELFAQQQQGTCHIAAAWRQERIIGFGSVALNAPGSRTYAMVLPHGQPPDGLREAVVEFARGRGYQQVDFPMETLAAKRGAQP